MSDIKVNNSKLNVSLNGLEVGLSGAIPERSNWSEPAMDRGILEFIALFSGLVFKYGGRVVHGCHPSFTPIILRQARLHAVNFDKPPITLVMSDLWFSDYTDEDIQSLTDIAELIVTKKLGDGDISDPTTRNQSLTAMRQVLISSQNLMVTVGGKMHDKDGFNPGVAEEMHFAELLGMPRYLVGGLGGYSKKLAKKLTPASLNNLLSREENIELFGTNDVSSCVQIIFENLCQKYWTDKSLNLSPTSLDTVKHLIDKKILPASI
ncbi:tyrosine-type recombinase/integrase [Serratia proteamaculans]